MNTDPMVGILLFGTVLLAPVEIFIGPDWGHGIGVGERYILAQNLFKVLEGPVYKWRKLSKRRSRSGTIKRDETCFDIDGQQKSRCV